MPIIWAIWAKLLLPQALKSCPKCNKSPNRVTLDPIKNLSRRALSIKNCYWFKSKQSLKMSLKPVAAKLAADVDDGINTVKHILLHHNCRRIMLDLLQSMTWSAQWVFKWSFLPHLYRTRIFSSKWCNFTEPNLPILCFKQSIPNDVVVVIRQNKFYSTVVDVITIFWGNLDFPKIKKLNKVCNDV